ncbi:BA14K family protein [Rhizobium rhizophilum]|uniref:Lectin-like protein BA14k n=1 Tax=Rhizobium rhizophilum TaxID=1850373 RepID=A0ABY2QXR6_9HYPH|nr:BA14K family protein [Rhizobium rhizophilum]THV15689.1 BA14K family protein [Rhizobium rhizophilum]
MMKFAQNALLAAAVTLTPIAAATQAEAGDRYHRQHRGDDALALGVLGLATGVIVGSALANPAPQRRVYVDRPVSVYDEPDYYVDDYPPPPPRNTYRPRPVYQQPQPVYQSYGIEPWTGAWHDYCSQRYRSFNPRTGTFVGYDGRTHFCTAG